MSSPTATLDPPVRAAVDDARRAAAAARVTVAELLTTDEVGVVASIVAAVWGPADAPPVNLLRAMARAGAVVLAAQEPDGSRPLGFAFGFLGWADGLHLHSHQVAVLPEARSRGVGFALKLAQRAVCLGRGVAEMRWTFDPLIAPNAHINLVRLGARAVAFIPDCYGVMGDAINGDDASDRLEVSWRLDRPVPPAGTRRRDRGEPRGGGRFDAGGGRLLVADADGAPARTGAPVRAGARVSIPPDYPVLRAARDGRARAWRRAVRDVLTDCFAAGLVIDGFGSDGYRLAVAGPAAPSPPSRDEPARTGRGPSADLPVEEEHP